MLTILVDIVRYGKMPLKMIIIANRFSFLRFKKEREREKSVCKFIVIIICIFFAQEFLEDYNTKKSHLNKGSFMNIKCEKFLDYVTCVLEIFFKKIFNFLCILIYLILSL